MEAPANPSNPSNPTVMVADISSSGRTWKMIKGKVSQTIEDIKSSKTSNSGTNNHATASTGTGLQLSSASNNSAPLANVLLKGEQHIPCVNETESDVERNYSIGEDLTLKEQEARIKGSCGSVGGSEGATIKLIKRHHKVDDSDTDFETEICFEGDWEPSKLRRGFETLKSRVKTKHTPSQQQLPLQSANLSAQSAKKETNLSRSTGSLPSNSLRGTFLRVRRNKLAEMSDLPPKTPTNLTAMAAVASGEMAASLPVVVSGKPDKQSSQTAPSVKRDQSEIESGVEMFEDMIPSSGVSSNPSLAKLSASDLSKLQTNSADEYTSAKESYASSSGQHSASTLDTASEFTAQSKSVSRHQLQLNAQFVNNLYNFKDLCKEILHSIRLLPVLATISLMVVLMLPIEDFLRGVLATVLFMTIVESFNNFLTSLISYYLLTYRPQNVNFEIPDYSKMSICEIPVAKEYQTVKSYEGWMNEIDDYDLNTFHVSLTKSVYVKLEGTILSVSNTNARIPKRQLWNEAPIDLKTIAFTTHRTYSLLGCRIDLLPLGLARKRHFNRKYPIQLIVKECSDTEGSITSKAKRRMKIAKHDKSTAEKLPANEPNAMEVDFVTTVLKADLQRLQDDVNPDDDVKNMTVPCANEVRLLLFARGAREKEDWYRRFVAASIGDVTDHDLPIGNIRLIDDHDLQAAAAAAAQTIINSPNVQLHASGSTKIKEISSEHTQDSQPTTSIPKVTIEEIASEQSAEKVSEVENEDGFIDLVEEEDKETIEGLIMASCAARNDRDYIRFMSLYQKACRQSQIPVYRRGTYQETYSKKYRKRLPRQNDDLWKGIDQSLFLGPSGSVVWLNVLMGRLIYSILQNNDLLEKIAYSFQKKLNAIKLPSFMEDVIIKDIDFGNTPFLVHRVSQPLIDERGVWLDADVTYEGLCHITVTTKLNLLRLKRPTRNSIVTEPSQFSVAQPINPRITVTLKDEAPSLRRGQDDELIYMTPSGSAIYDSDAESTGSSESEAEDHHVGAVSENANNENSSTPGNARRIFKFVDRLTTSHLFQYATEIPYVQKAMENMITNITLGIDIRGLVSRVTINIPPPPSDRVWIAFRAPPRLWLSARPTVGDKSVDWSIVTNIIEGKLCEAVNKYLVYPNMVDVTIPFLGKPNPTEGS